MQGQPGDGAWLEEALPDVTPLRLLSEPLWVLRAPADGAAVPLAAVGRDGRSPLRLVRLVPLLPTATALYPGRYPLQLYPDGLPHSILLHARGPVQAHCSFHCLRK